MGPRPSRARRGRAPKPPPDDARALEIAAAFLGTRPRTRWELERRLLIMQGCYEHDRYQVLGEAPGPNGERIVRVQITRGNRTRTANFAITRGPSDRWYVRDADFEAVRDLCA